MAISSNQSRYNLRETLPENLCCGTYYPFAVEIMATHRELVSKVVKIEPEIKNRLEQLGKLKHRKPHWLMKEAIIRYLEQEEYNEQLKQETLARWQEAESGKIVSNDAVLKWLDTWGTESESDRPPCVSSYA